LVLAQPRDAAVVELQVPLVPGVALVLVAQVTDDLEGAAVELPGREVVQARVGRRQRGLAADRERAVLPPVDRGAAVIADEHPDAWVDQAVMRAAVGTLQVRHRERERYPPERAPSMAAGVRIAGRWRASS